MKRKSLTVAFIGHSGIEQKEARQVVNKYFTKLSRKYEIDKIVTIKDDLVGKYARISAKKAGVALETFYNMTGERNLIPAELVVGGTMWAANSFVLVMSDDKKKSYSRIAQTMCERMRRKYLITK